MAKQSVMWTVLPKGRDADGMLLVSVVVSPRLTPQAPDERRLAAFPDFLDWPSTLAAARFDLEVGSDTAALDLVSKPDPAMWARFFGQETPVAGFVYKDMGAANLHSFPVRNVLGALRRHYRAMAQADGEEHPRLLPWSAANPALKGMLEDFGTRTVSNTFASETVELMLPGFSRFFGAESAADRAIRRTVFGQKSVYTAEIPAIGVETAGPPQPGGTAERRALPPNWYHPRPGGPGAPLVSRPDAVVMDQFATGGEYTLYQAMKFYRREAVSKADRQQRYPSYENIAPPPAVPAFDFHRIVASYGDYAHLTRALGLVLDFKVRPDPFASADGLMRLRISWDSDRDASGDTTPTTAWVMEDERFALYPRTPTIRRGMLALERADDGWGESENDGPFDLYQVDPDGAAIKTTNFTLSAQNLLSRHLNPHRPDGAVTYTTGDRQPVAALRAGGIGVSQHGRAMAVAAEAAAQTAKNAALDNGQGDQITFFAEDVTKGYRVDVWPMMPKHLPDAKDGPWYSLMLREGDWRAIAQDEALSFPPEEGHVSAASTTSSADPATNPDDHYLHETLFRWSGWSLAAPRPGKSIRAAPVEGTQLQGEVPAEGAETAAEGNNLAVDWKVVKGSLPRLRFGWSYRFRARVVDIAGNSVSLDDPTLDKEEQISEPVGYWRFEPVDPPAMIGRHRLSEGESLERMVIRSDWDRDAASYLTKPEVTTATALPESQDFDYRALNERHLVPPKSSQSQCETHGAFDPYFGDWKSIRDGYKIAAREDQTLYHPTPGADIALITPAVSADIAQADSVPPDAPTPEEPVGQRLVGGQYVIHREARVVTPYLPDVAAAGMAIRAAPGLDLPGVRSEAVLGEHCAIANIPTAQGEAFVILVFFSNPWPDSDGFRLVLAERAQTVTDLPCDESFEDNGAPLWDEENRVLTLFLPKGRIARLRYSSFVDPDHLGSFGIVRWAGEGPDNQGPVWVSSALGCHWMVTPYRDLKLVHATQAPVCQPELLKLTPWRDVGDQTARLNCRTVRLHGPSTGKFEIEAEWDEWIDDINDPDGPQRVARRGQLGEIALPENHRDAFILSQAVRAQMVDPDKRPRAPQDVHEIGDTRFRLVRYRARATTRFREYLPPSIYADTDLITRLGPVAEGPAFALPAADDPGAPVLRDAAGSTAQSLVPASQAPDDPRVLYVVPTFHWSESGDGDTVEKTRLGNGLRVWLDRPWFSSGDGELLGVVILGEGRPFAEIPDNMQGLVTQWGQDPLWVSANPRSVTRATDFAARVIEEDLPLQEAAPGDAAVRVIGHRVRWDGDRKLWYCDIEFDPGATYMPFARLALVRYQPNALPSQKISKVVLAEFSQVLPRRRARFTRGPTAEIQLYGPVPRRGPLDLSADLPIAGRPMRRDQLSEEQARETGRNRFEVVLQTRDPGMNSDMAWEDTAILDSAIVGGGSDGLVVSADISGGIFSQPAIAAATDRVVEARAGGPVRLRAGLPRTLTAIGAQAGASIPTAPVFEQPFWTVREPIPATGGRPARLMVREFERYYTDDTLARPRGRRVVEERLVYAATFDL